MRVLAISGSLRRDSYNTRLAHAAVELAPWGVDVELYPPHLLAAIPPYDADVDDLGQPDAVTELKQAIRSADAVLVATPEYNSSIPGHLKNALDWVSRPLAESPLRGKPTTVVGASTSAYGAVWAQADLRKVLGVLGARVVEAEVAVAHAAERFDDAGRLTDEETREQLAQAIRDLVDAAAPVPVAA
jgi:chromate reductase, NAD(P)H dehydrogenase (quinone)